MRFPYVKIPTSDPTKKWISRPMISVILSGPAKSVIVDALIDSGADKSLFHIDLAKEIGLDLSEGKREIFSGAEGGQIDSFVHKIQIQVIGLEERIEIPAGFTDCPGVFAILGQEGFFDAFQIKFEKANSIVEIAEAEKYLSSKRSFQKVST